MSWDASFSSLGAAFTLADGTPSMPLRGRTSSAKRMVDSTSAPSSGRMAARYCLSRITTVPIATRWASSMAASSRR